MVAPSSAPWSPVSAVSSVSRDAASPKSLLSFAASPSLSPVKAAGPRTPGRAPRAERTERTEPLKEQWSMTDFDIGKRIDKGKFGVVYVARCRRSQLVVAMKVLSKRMAIATKMERQVEREVNNQFRLRHPNILRLYAYFWDRKKVYLVLEYAAKGDLFKQLKRQQPARFREPVAAYYMAQIAGAVSYLHKACVIHRDIKPENMLLTLDNVVKLADFGWSVHCPQSSRRSTFCGTLDYLAPEIVASQQYDFGIDIWGLGVLLFELIAGDPPFDNKGEQKHDTYRRIKEVSFAFPPGISAGARELVSGFLQKDSAERLGLDTALVHPWMQAAEKDPT